MFLSLTLGRRIALVAGVVGLIFSFFHWYTASYDAGVISGSVSISGWHGWGIISVLLLIASGVVAVLPLVGIPSLRSLVPTLPPVATDGMVLLGAGVIAILTTLLFMF